MGSEVYTRCSERDGVRRHPRGTILTLSELMGHELTKRLQCRRWWGHTSSTPTLRGLTYSVWVVSPINVTPECCTETPGIRLHPLLEPRWSVYYDPRKGKTDSLPGPRTTLQIGVSFTNRNLGRKWQNSHLLTPF